tara:strand:- start:1384 stop:1953 length:570 start_codon:yes stop_codon:yes gene_type:complete
LLGFNAERGEIMNFKKQILVLVITMLIPFALSAEEAVGGSIAVIDVEAAILSTEASKQAFEELSTSKEWKEVDEDLQLKINEAKDIQEKLQKEGPTMSDEDKLDAQKRLNSLSQDANFLNQKLTTMRNELVGLLQNEQAPKFQKVVSELMRAKGIKILLHRQSVLGFDTGDPTLNLTPEVVELLNQTEE